MKLSCVLLPLAGFALGWFIAIPFRPSKPPRPVVYQTNIVNNGLDSWLADTNHSFGPKLAKRIFVMQLPDGKWHIRYLNDTTNYVALFGDDIAFDSADEARRMLTINMDLQIKKAVSDSMENAFK